MIAAALFIIDALANKNLNYHLPFVAYGGTFKFNDLCIIGIPVYWVMMISGFIITVIVSFFRRVAFKMDIIRAVLIPICFLAISYIGTKLLYIAENIKSFSFERIKFSGVSLFGAIYAVLLTVPLISLLFGVQIPAMYDIVTPFGLILLTSVRTGCFMNGCLRCCKDMGGKCTCDTACTAI